MLSGELGQESVSVLFQESVGSCISEITYSDHLPTIYFSGRIKSFISVSLFHHAPHHPSLYVAPK